MERAAAQGADFRFLYELETSIPEKIGRIAAAMYGADGVEYGEAARRQIARCEAAGLGGLPICMAKTPYSFTGDPSIKGRPSGFTILVRDIKIAAGAGFVTPLIGSIQTMPGLGKQPAGLGMDVTPDGRLIGIV